MQKNYLDDKTVQASDWKLISSLLVGVEYAVVGGGIFLDDGTNGMLLSVGATFSVLLQDSGLVTIQEIATGKKITVSGIGTICCKPAS